MGLLILGLVGCAAKHDPFGQQVQRADEVSSRQGEQSFSQGDLTRPPRSFSRALEVGRAVDYPPGEAQQLNNLGAVALEQGDLKKAGELFTRAWEMNQDKSIGATPASTRPTWPPWPKRPGRWRTRLNTCRRPKTRPGGPSPPAQGLVLVRWASFYLDRQNYGRGRGSAGAGPEAGQNPVP